MNISHYILHIHINIHKHTDRPTKLYTGDLYITKNSNICKIQENEKTKNKMQCARTCDSGCSFLHALQSPNTQPYIGRSRSIIVKM